MQNVNYSEKLKARFAENGGKLFFADGFKNRAFTAVKEILSSEESLTSVCVVDGIQTAEQVKTALYEGASDSIVDVDGETPTEIVEEILACVKIK